MQLSAQSGEQPIKGRMLEDRADARRQDDEEVYQIQVHPGHTAWRPSTDTLGRLFVSKNSIP